MDLEDLPLDVWGYILQFLDPCSKENLCLLSRSMNLILNQKCYRVLLKYPYSENLSLRDDMMESCRGSYCPLDSFKDLDEINLKVLKYVTQLYVRDFILVNDFFIQNRASLNNLVELKLKWCSSLSNYGLSQISKFFQLKALHISNTRKVNDFGISCLTRLTNLKDLIIEYCPSITCLGFDFISHLVGLRLLQIRCCQEIWIRTIEKLRDLRFLELHIRSKNIQLLSNLTNLTSLTLGNGIVVNDFDMPFLIPLKTIVHLSFSGTLSDIGLEHLSDKTNLESLQISSPNVTEEGISKCLTSLKNMEVLHMISCSIDRISCFSLFGSLSELWIINCSNVTESNVSPTANEMKNLLKGLKELIIRPK